jgi:hypothetical protein
MRPTRRDPAILALIYTATIAAQPIQTSANTRTPTPHPKPPGYSHAFARCEKKGQPPVRLRIEIRKRLPASHFADKSPKTLRPESANSP